MANLFVYLLNLSSSIVSWVGDEGWKNKERFVGNLEGPLYLNRVHWYLNLLLQEQFWLAFSHGYRLNPPTPPPRLLYSLLGELRRGRVVPTAWNPSSKGVFILGVYMIIAEIVSLRWYFSNEGLPPKRFHNTRPFRFPPDSYSPSKRSFPQIPTDGTSPPRPFPVT